MPINIELPSDKLLRFNERAKLIGLSPDDLAQRVVELIADTPDDEFESWLETLEILADKNFALKLNESMAQVERGEVENWDRVKRELGMI